MDGTFRAVVDRVVDNTTAVLLVEDDGEVIEQVTVPVEALPDEVGEGDRLSLTISEGRLISIEPNTGETRAREESIEETFDRLSRRLSDE